MGPIEARSRLETQNSEDTQYVRVAGSEATCLLRVAKKIPPSLTLDNIYEPCRGASVADNDRRIVAGKTVREWRSQFDHPQAPCQIRQMKDEAGDPIASMYEVLVSRPYIRSIYEKVGNPHAYRGTHFLISSREILAPNSPVVYGFQEKNKEREQLTLILYGLIAAAVQQISTVNAEIKTKIDLLRRYQDRMKLEKKAEIILEIDQKMQLLNTMVDNYEEVFDIVKFLVEHLLHGKEKHTANDLLIGTSDRREASVLRVLQVSLENIKEAAEFKSIDESARISLFSRLEARISKLINQNCNQFLMIAPPKQITFS